MKRVAGVVVALSISFGFGELLARSLDLVDRINPFPRRLYMATDEPDLPYCLRPGVETKLFNTVPVYINRAGLRDREVSPVPAPGKMRLLALGDSVTFGWVCPIESSYPRLLERLLQRRGNPVEVLNGGVPGYDTVAEAAFLRVVGLRVAPAIVLLQVNANDYEPPPWMNAMGVLTGSGERIAAWSPANWSEFYLLLRWLILMVRLRVWLPGISPFHPPDFGAAPATFTELDRQLGAKRLAFYHHPDVAAWQRLERGFASLAAVARSHGIKLLAWLQPDGDQFTDTVPDREPQRRLGELCRTNGIEHIDLFDPMSAAGGARLYSDVSHPNARGLRVIVHALARWLRPMLHDLRH